MARITFDRFVTHIDLNDTENVAAWRDHYKDVPHIEHRGNTHYVFHDIRHTCELCKDTVEMKAITE